SLASVAISMVRTLPEWIDYIQTLHARTIDLGLARVEAVWQRIKPENLPTVITIAGTNGKGSSVSMLESVYQKAGYQTGTYTSPHLVHFNERVRINNISVDDATLLAAFERIEAVRGEIALTFFEFGTLLALDIFSQANLDVWILEVGLGGRLDATNVVENDLALITAIGIDHIAWLGNDKESIGHEKAGIIKRNGKVVIADPNAPSSITKFARQQGAQMWAAGIDYKVEMDESNQARFKVIESTLSFNQFKIRSELAHIKNNTAGVVAVISALSMLLPVNKAQLVEGLAQQSLAGRLQWIVGQPNLLLDVSHNEDSVLAMIAYLDGLREKGEIKGRVIAIFAALQDKQYHQAFTELKQRVDSWHLASLDGERGQSAHSLAEALFVEGLPDDDKLSLHSTPKGAYDKAMSEAKEDDLIVIFGSFHLVGAIMPLVNS
ncbi:MAG: bifunctional tetrahydrofolate synthase/dihydrofolate synthase, partial [Arenicellales bacterium]